MMKRIRNKLRPRITYVERTDHYFRLRYWWLHEIRQLRAKRRVNGIVTRSEIKAAQRALAKVRRDEVMQ